MRDRVGAAVRRERPAQKVKSTDSLVDYSKSMA